MDDRGREELKDKIANEFINLLDKPVGRSVLKTTQGHRVGRNEICPCGSKKKFKRCCSWKYD
jgi:uncharacterized protein YecA (UPF0149 family)